MLVRSCDDVGSTSVGGLGSGWGSEYNVFGFVKQFLSDHCANW